jgi:hypothetical protein
MKPDIYVLRKPDIAKDIAPLGDRAQNTALEAVTIGNYPCSRASNPSDILRVFSAVAGELEHPLTEGNIQDGT